MCIINSLLLSIFFQTYNFYLFTGHAAVKDYLTEEALADMTEMIEDFYYADVIVVLRKNSYYTDKLTVFVGRLKQSGLMLAWETQVIINN